MKWYALQHWTRLTTRPQSGGEASGQGHRQLSRGSAQEHQAGSHQEKMKRADCLSQSKLEIFKHQACINKLLSSTKPKRRMPGKQVPQKSTRAVNKNLKPANQSTERVIHPSTTNCFRATPPVWGTKPSNTTSMNMSSPKSRRREPRQRESATSRARRRSQIERSLCSSHGQQPDLPTTREMRRKHPSMGSNENWDLPDHGKKKHWHLTYILVAPVHLHQQVRILDCCSSFWPTEWQQHPFCIWWVLAVLCSSHETLNKCHIDKALLLTLRSRFAAL